MLDKLISTFIWQKKIKVKQLMYPKKQGGLSLYIWAAQPPAMIEWILQNEETNCLELEKSSHSAFI